jgi:hypothetical protein
MMMLEEIVERLERNSLMETDYLVLVEYFEQHLIIARDTRDRRGEGYALGCLGNIYAAVGQTHKAIEYLSTDGCKYMPAATGAEHPALDAGYASVGNRS